MSTNFSKQLTMAIISFLLMKYFSLKADFLTMGEVQFQKGQL